MFKIDPFWEIYLFLILLRGFWLAFYIETTHALGVASISDIRGCLSRKWVMKVSHSIRERHFSSPRRGNYNFDGNNSHGDREENMNANPKS